MTNIIPVVLAGGSGTRLWPLSRKSHPKQNQLEGYHGHHMYGLHINACMQQPCMVPHGNFIPHGHGL